MKQIGLLLCLFAVCLLSDCTVIRGKKTVRQWASAEDTVRVAQPLNAPLRLSYIGCGGVLLEYGGEAILLDPYFSNISMAGAVTRPLRPDTALIDAFFRARDAASVATVLISHAHHDHLADLPTVLRRHLSRERVQVFGSNTMVNILRSFPDLVADTAWQFRSLERYFEVFSDVAGQPSRPTHTPFVYTPLRRMRFAAIPSNHAGHYRFFGPNKLPFTEGEISQPFLSPPTHALQFKEGKNFNYLIDLLDDAGNPIFRIVSNAGAATDNGVGFPSEALLAEKPTDLLLLCGANYTLAHAYPWPLLQHLKPQTVFVAHWENFFKSVPRLLKQPETVPNTNIPAFLRLLSDFSQKNGYPKDILLEEPQKRSLYFVKE